MKKWVLFQLLIFLLSLTSCESDAYQSFAEHFSDTASFAYAEVSGRKVLLVSHETFGNNVNQDKEAIEATIFALDAKGKIISLGSIRSQGTLYPVTLWEGQLVVGGHQFVRIYGIRGDVPELVLNQYEEGDSDQLMQMYETFEKGTPIKFKRSLSQP